MTYSVPYVSFVFVNVEICNWGILIGFKFSFLGTDPTIHVFVFITHSTVQSFSLMPISKKNFFFAFLQEQILS